MFRDVKKEDNKSSSTITREELNERYSFLSKLDEDGMKKLIMFIMFP